MLVSQLQEKSSLGLMRARRLRASDKAINKKVGAARPLCGPIFGLAAGSVYPCCMTEMQNLHRAMLAKIDSGSKYGHPSGK